MKPFIRKLFAFLIIAILALTISIVSYYFLIGQEPNKEKINVEVKATVFKEDGVGGWTPITTPDEIIDGYLNFECNITNYDYIKSKSLNITLVEFYLSNSVPDIQNPTLNEYSLIKTSNDDKDQYFSILDSRTLPDDMWYFISRVVDSQNKSVYDTYDINDLLIPFSIEYFDDSITFNYLDSNGRINYNSHIEFLVNLGGFGQYIKSVDLFIVYNQIPEILTGTPIDYSEIQSNYNLLSLEMLSPWIESNSIPPNDYNVSFIVTLHLNYGNNFPIYHHDYPLPSIILDIKGPEITLTEQSLILGATYWDEWNNILTALIESNATDFNAVSLYFMYDIWYPEGEWVFYDTFSGDPPIGIVYNILNLRDDKIHLRFTAYDDLGNPYTLEGPDYWIVRDFDDHLDFGLEGIGNYYFYTLSGGMIDLRVTVYPVDNDITKVGVVTDYEYSELTNVNVEGDHIFFTEEGDLDIKLDPIYYNIYGSLFTAIPIEVMLFQGSTYITRKDITILATYVTFQDKVNISNIEIDPNITQSDNIWMSFTTGTDSYNNSHETPYIANNNPPVARIYNPQDALVEAFAISPDFDDTGLKNYTQGYIKIQNNFFNLSLAGLGEICTIDAIAIQGSYYDFNYFIHNEIVYIKLLTGVNLDGIYGSSGAISMNYTISNVTHLNSQYKANFDFHTLPPDNYTVVGEFYDISGRISAFTLNIRLWHLLNDLIIDTPENITYIAPIDGYYPATYGFDNETAGTIATNIGFIDFWNGDYDPWDLSAMIVSEIGGHKNILREQNTLPPGGYRFDIIHIFNYNHLSGHCEFWFRCTNPLTISQFLFMEGAIPGPHPQVKDGYFNYYDGTEHNLTLCNPDQWYHLAFEWYSNNTFDWYIDGTKILEGGSNLYNMLNGPDRIRLSAYPVTANYFDAFGFSWDPSYNIGDNRNEGLLLAFKKASDFGGSSLTWTGYSLDNHATITIIGNTTIPLPSEGLHTIQVFGKDIFGYIHYSEIRFFYIDI